MVTGFLLTGLVGQYLASVYQENAWYRESQHELFRQEIGEATKVLEEVTGDISKRAYAMQKLHWALESTDKQRIKQASKEYLAIKDNWNIKVIIYRNKLKRLVDSDLAYILLDSDNGKNVPKDASVQAAFINAHSKLVSWKNCAENRSCEDIEAKAKAKQSLTELYEFADVFIDDAYRIFLSKYKRLRNVNQKL